MAKQRLGTNLNALLGSAKLSSSATGDLAVGLADDLRGGVDGELRHIPIEFIGRGKYQPRRDMHPDSLEELADSIKEQGIIQPIVVRSVAENRYEIIAGERRWRAAQIAGLDEIPSLIKDIAEDSTVAAMAIIENIQREDLNPIEEAMAFSRLQKEFELTQQEVAKFVGKSRTAVANTLRLMSLGSEVKKMLEYGDLEMGHARAMLTLSESDQFEVASIIVAKGLSVRQTESLVRRLQQEKNKGEKSKKGLDPDIKRLEEDLSEKIGAKVAIQCNAKGKGRVMIPYNSLDELDGILEHIK
ncbi:MAG: ParB/RepB/Spo0J family partition protein [Candidatus Endonucleobacter bathymodioli]|uniref:Probable chromosome-partitioning protein ParB n=1 Tax=Candidatus Endonucleibacter bathymodioli TaxID=539814 RepID=A0AA90SS43_9GAMM|nr:ParB/RepB/Spo0J family partition protein [Candidatus Endonucleobacter bathymodioli]MDP0590312.1 ParB/RepB/Spo0J family partition protein [Candidatus Endonucleobacter bathymodioli]